MNLTLFYRHVTVLDYAYLDPKLGVVGNSLYVNASFEGTTDDEGVVYDFSYAKKKVKAIIDDVCDHRLVVPSGVVKSENQGHENIEFTYSFGERQELIYKTPSEGIFFMGNDLYSNDSLLRDLEQIIIKELPENIQKITLEFENERLDKNKAFYHYTHGLKDHYGNCQRLLHGHCNTIDLFINGKQSSSFENKLSELFPEKNIHFAYTENVKNIEEVHDRFAGKEVLGVAPGKSFPIEIEYESQQGLFRAVIPSFMVHFVEMETTVENLSTHFWNWLKDETNKGDKVKVRAYEGIGKGAITQD